MHLCKSKYREQYSNIYVVVFIQYVALHFLNPYGSPIFQGHHVNEWDHCFQILMLGNLRSPSQQIYIISANYLHTYMSNWSLSADYCSAT